MVASGVHFTVKNKLQTSLTHSEHLQRLIAWLMMSAERGCEKPRRIARQTSEISRQPPCRHYCTKPSTKLVSHEAPAQASSGWHLNIFRGLRKGGLVWARCSGGERHGLPLLPPRFGCQRLGGGCFHSLQWIPRLCSAPWDTAATSCQLEVASGLPTPSPKVTA